MKTALILLATNKATGRELRGTQAWTDFAKDVWLMKFPFTVAGLNDQEALVQMLSKSTSDMMSNQIVLKLFCDYKDLAGKCYECSAEIAWNPLTETEEVRPGPVRLVECKP